MKESNKNSVYFVCGTAAKESLLGVVSYLHEADEAGAEFTRFYMIKNGEWVGQLEFHHEIKGVSFDPEIPAWILLSKRGTVIEISGSGEHFEEITDAGTGPNKLGYLNCIRRIEGTFYACGYRRQVYVYSEGAWRHSDSEILLGKESIGYGFSAISGASPSTLLAVGRKGEVFQGDGRQWRQIDSGTNVNLTDCCWHDSKTAYACGKKGTVLRISENTSELLVDPAFTESLWSICSFEGRILAAHAKGIVEITDDGFVPVEIPAETAGQLVTHGSRLWSIGTYDVLSYDGEVWTQLPCADNE